MDELNRSWLDFNANSKKLNKINIDDYILNKNVEFVVVEIEKASCKKYEMSHLRIDNNDINISLPKIYKDSTYYTIEYSPPKETMEFPEFVVDRNTLSDESSGEEPALQGEMDSEINGIEVFSDSGSETRSETESETENEDFFAQINDENENENKNEDENLNWLKWLLIVGIIGGIGIGYYYYTKE